MDLGSEISHSFKAITVPMLYNQEPNIERIKLPSNHRPLLIPEPKWGHLYKVSIKKKLKESGTYIDDELPEYIMVMIANKRTEYQMKEDLSLFLGDETDKFVTWLFAMLKRLQNAAKVEVASSEASLTKDAGSHEVKDIEHTKAETLLKSGAISKEFENKEHNLPTPHEEDNIQYYNNKNVDKSAERNKDVRAEEDLSMQIPEEHDKKEKGDKDESLEEKRKLKRRRSSSSHSQKRDATDEINSKRHSNEEKSSRQRKRSEGSSKRQHKRSVCEDDEADEIPSVASQITIQKVRPNLPASKQASSALIKRAMQEANNSVQSKSRPHSKRKTEREAVVEPCDISIEFKNDRRITHHKREKKLEERSKMVATVDDQDEARKSDQSDDDIEAGGKRLRLGDNEKSQDDGIEVEVPENEFLDEESVSKKRADKRIVIAHRSINRTENIQSDPENIHSDHENIENDRIEENNESLDGYKKVEDEKHIDDSKKTEVKDNVDEKSDRYRKERRKHRHRKERTSHRERRHNSPRFVVTLHGALDEAEKQKRRKHRRSRRDYSSSDESPLFIDMFPKAPMKILESAQLEIDKMAHRLDLMQNLTSAPGIKQYNLPPASNSLTMSTLNPAITSLPSMPTMPANVLPDQYNPAAMHTNSFLPQHALTGMVPLQTPVIVMQNMSERKKSSTTKTKVREVVVPLRAENNDDMSDAESTENMIEEGETEVAPERCKFWPSCKNSSCQYIHPSKPCRTFPNCNFKDKCIFLHPICKFDTRCTKPSCPFTHTKKQKNILSSNFQNGTSMDMSVPLCRFYPNCSKTNCTFRHPSSKACRYGSGCNRSDCPFHHETRPATGGALKWSINSTQSPKHISDRTFAASPHSVTSIPITVVTSKV